MNGPAASRPAIRGPLRRDPRNPRYFVTADGVPTLLTGSHTWNNLVDMGPRDSLIPFDWDAYLDFLDDHGHNFIRLWSFGSLGTWNPRDAVATLPWKRSGPGRAADGGPCIDLAHLDPDYFERLRIRVATALGRGIYVSVMLFECWSSFDRNEAPVDHHVFAAQNNINGIDLESTPHHGSYAAWITTRHPEALAIQEAYVRRVVEAVSDLDNVLYEIANEGGPHSHQWQEHMIALIRSSEAATGRRHPVGRTGGMGDANGSIHTSSADWVAPDAFAVDGQAMGYRTGHYTYGSGPHEAGDRPILLDTDHLWGVGGDVTWAWKSFCRGYNILYMDPWNDQPAAFFDHPRWPARADVGLRREMGVIHKVSERIDLAAAQPMDEVASSGYCLGVPGRQLVAFQPAAASISLRLGAADWELTWHDPTSGRTRPETSITVGRDGTWELEVPFLGPSVVIAKRLE